MPYISRDPSRDSLPLEHHRHEPLYDLEKPPEPNFDAIDIAAIRRLNQTLLRHLDFIHSSVLALLFKNLWQILGGRM